MVVSDPDIHRTARLHLERHGDEAVAKARAMVRNLKERGDNEAARHLVADHCRDRGVAAWVGDMMGELVMEALAMLDQVAFIRSASVYRNFREAKDFGEFVGQITADDD